jgi:hypothetical protein
MKGFGKVLGKSILKGLKITGKVAGSAALVAGLGALADPAALGALVALGPYGPLAVIGINFVANTVLDAYKHRGKADEEEGDE